MLGWAYEATLHSQSSDLCELYCGNGCFTVALAPNFRNVLATEVSKASVRLAEQNLAANGVRNARVARLSAEEFASAYELAGDRDGLGGDELAGGDRDEAPPADEIAGDRDEEASRGLRRLVDAGIVPADARGLREAYAFGTVLVDPPRAGLDDKCRRLVARFERILYVSCNPLTLLRDLGELVATGTHQVVSLALFDQFRTRRTWSVASCSSGGSGGSPNFGASAPIL